MKEEPDWKSLYKEEVTKTMHQNELERRRRRGIPSHVPFEPNPWPTFPTHGPNPFPLPGPNPFPMPGPPTGPNPFQPPFPIGPTGPNPFQPTCGGYGDYGGYWTPF